MQVLVCIEPPVELAPVGDVLQTRRHVTFHDSWLQAINHVKSFAQGDDPGQVTMLTVHPLQPSDNVRSEPTP